MSASVRPVLVLLAATALPACGGGGGGGGFVGVNATGVTTGTITGFGSVIVNGTEYDTSNSTSVEIDDASGLLSSLEVGQNVTLTWTSTDDGATRDATQIRYDDTVEGPITAASIDLDTQSFTVLGQTVLVDADTSFASPLFDLESLAGGDFVEVSGLFDSFGAIRATRIERKVAGGLEIRGFVSALDTVAGTFAINDQDVAYSGLTSLDPSTLVLANGQLVEVSGTTVNGLDQLVATRIELEDEDDLIGDDDDEAEVEGYVDQFTSVNAFEVSGVPVISSVAATGGTVALNAKVRVKGTFNASGSIVATSVEVRSGASGSVVNARLSANVTSINVAGNSLVVRGINVLLDSNTRFEDQRDDEREFSLADLAVGDFVAVRGVASGNTQPIRATILERQDDDVEGLFRGNLTALADPEFSILGVSVDTDDFTEFYDVFDDEILAEDFFGGAVLVGDEVKIRFNLDDPAFLATTVEIEEESD
jgi:hypothetical protein